MQHLQEEGGNAADHHGRNIAVDPPNHRGRGIEGMGRACHRLFAPVPVIEYGLHPPHEEMLQRVARGLGQRIGHLSLSASGCCGRVRAKPTAIVNDHAD